MPLRHLSSVVIHDNTLTGDGTSASPLSVINNLNNVSTNILSTINNINAKTTGTTDLYTVPINKIAIITGAIIRITSANTITNAPTLGIGRNITQDDMFASITLTGLNIITNVYIFTGIGVLATAAAGEIIKLGIDTGATATTMIISVDLIGYIL